MDAGGYFCGPEQSVEASFQNWVEALWFLSAHSGQYGNI